MNSLTDELAADLCGWTAKPVPESFTEMRAAFKAAFECTLGYGPALVGEQMQSVSQSFFQQPFSRTAIVDADEVSFESGKAPAA